MTRFISFFAKSLYAFLIVGGTLTTNLQAQSNEIIVHVPFSFNVGSQKIAPGTYQFSQVSSQFLLSVVDIKTGNKQFFDVRPELLNKSDERGSLIFRSSTGRSILNEIHFPGADTFSELIEPRRVERTEAVRSTTGGNAVGLGQP